MTDRHVYYLKYFLGCNNVLDVGCKEGEFIDLLKKNNITASGIDIDKKACDACTLKGLDVVCEDAVELLKKTDSVYGGIYVSHVIEHLQPEKVISLIKNSFNALKNNGRLVIITPDVRNIKDVMHGFWEDHTHIRPYPLSLLEKIYNDAGFLVIEAKEKRMTYKGRLFWKIRDSFRNKMFGDYWGRDEIYIIGQK